MHDIMTDHLEFCFSSYSYLHLSWGRGFQPWHRQNIFSTNISFLREEMNPTLTQAFLSNFLTLQLAWSFFSPIPSSSWILGKLYRKLLPTIFVLSCTQKPSMC